MGLKLEESGPKDYFCESCAYTKATRLPVAKVRGGERAKALGEEVHSDVWGLAQVPTRRGRHFMPHSLMITLDGLTLIFLRRNQMSLLHTRTLRLGARHSSTHASSTYTWIGEANTHVANFNSTSNLKAPNRS